MRPIKHSSDDTHNHPESEDAHMAIKKLTILHSNDLHGDFLAEKVDDKLIGGVSYLSGYIKNVRMREPNVLYAVAGDMFQGSVIDREFRGISTIEIMNLLAPDVVCIGNHEADYGLSHLLFLEKCARFPIINANLHIKTNYARLFEPYITFDIGGMKVLFIGVITEDILSNAISVDHLIGSFVNIEDVAKEVSTIIDAYKTVHVDYTVILSHIGFEQDQKLAGLLNPELGVDLIIGGHSHTLMDQPVVVNGIQIVQAGVGTDQIGHFEVMIDTDTHEPVSSVWRCVPINETTCEKDKELENIILHYKGITDEKYDRFITKLNRSLTHPDRHKETELGNLFADVLSHECSFDILFLGSGSIRSTRMDSIVRYRDFAECFPYDGTLYMVEVTGALLRKMLKYIFRDEGFYGGHTEFFQINSRLRLIYDFAEKTFVSVSFDGHELEDSEHIKLALQHYFYTNSESALGVRQEELHAFKNAIPIATSITSFLMERLSASNHLNGKIDGRITVLNAPE